MRDRLSSILSTITPFSTPDQYPVIPYGNAERIVQFVTKPIANSKGMIEVQTMPDLADGGKPLTLSVRQSLFVSRWHRVKR